METGVAHLELRIQKTGEEMHFQDLFAKSEDKGQKI